MATKTGLGTGLGALFGDSKNLIQTEALPFEKIEPRNDQPRTIFNEPALEELAGSIAQHGVLQPITVRRVNKENYQIITGERRWRAARQTVRKPSIFRANTRLFFPHIVKTSPKLNFPQILANDVNF